MPPLTEPDHDLIRDKYFPSDAVGVVVSAEVTLGRLVIRLSDRAGIEAIRRRRITDGRRDIPLLKPFGLSSVIFSISFCVVVSAALERVLVLKTRLGVEAMRRKLDLDGFMLVVVYAATTTFPPLSSCGAAAGALLLLLLLISFGLRGACGHPDKEVMRRSLDGSMVEEAAPPGL